MYLNSIPHQLMYMSGIVVKEVSLISVYIYHYLLKSSAARNGYGQGAYFTGPYKMLYMTKIFCGTLKINWVSSNWFPRSFFIAEVLS